MLQRRIIKKDKRENKMVVYTEEDKELVIPVGLGNFGSGSGGGSARLQDKSVTQNTQTASYGPDAGYDGLSKINVDATPYGNAKEQQGYNRGYTTGWGEGYPQGVNDGFVSGHESGYTDGYAEGEVVGQARGYVIGHTSGVTDGIAEQKAKLQSATFESNGTYTREDGWSAVTVDAKSNLAIAGVHMNHMQYTFYKDNLVQGPNGETAYGGNLDDFKAYIDEKELVQIKSWYNPEQTSSILQAIIQQNSAGTYEWIAYQAEPFIITPLEDIPSTWTQMDTYGGLFARYDGTYLYIYWNYEYGAFFTDSRDRILPDEDLFFSGGYDGISAITIDASNIYQSGHTALDISGFEVGLGFYGPATVTFNNFDSDYPMHRYLIDMINPETGQIINIDSDFDGVTWSFSGNGYHMIWMTPKSDIPSGVEWAAISGYRGDHVNIVLTDFEYEVGNFMRTAVNVSYLNYYSSTDDAHYLVKYLMEF